MSISNPVKAIIGLIVAFALSVMGARLAFEASGPDEASSTAAPWAQNKMEFIAWNGQRWTAWLRDGNFELTPENEGNWHRHANSSIAYIGWGGEPIQARLHGEQFQIAHRGEWHAAVEEVEAIHYIDWSGVRRVRSVEQLTR